MKKIYFISLILLILFSGCLGNLSVYQNPIPELPKDEFSIACWNLQIFGQSKASDSSLLSYYADKLDDHDIFIIQEIRDQSGTSITKLAEKFPNYDYIVSNRAGTTQSKEQYAIFYHHNIIFESSYDFTPILQLQFERPPFQATFRADNWTFTIYTSHLKPDDVDRELSNFERLVSQLQSDVILIGDFNADGSYYDESSINHFTTWNWVITNDMDTTVAESSNTYDRIIINSYAENNFIRSGIMNDVNADQSDHYLIYAVFDTSTS